MKISVIVPTYNRLHTLLQTLRSLQEQTLAEFGARLVRYFPQALEGMALYLTAAVIAYAAFAALANRQAITAELSVPRASSRCFKASSDGGMMNIVMASGYRLRI